MTLVSFGIEHVRRLRFVREGGFAGNSQGVFYSVAELVDGARDGHSLWLSEPDGSGPRRLADRLGDIGSCAASPDGSSLAIVAETDGRPQIWLVPADGGAARSLTALAQGVSGRSVWSPDGRRIAFTAGPAERRDPALPYLIDRDTYRFDGLGHLDDVVTDLYVVDVLDGEVRRLTADRAMNSEPRWSPDGRSLCYLMSFPPDEEWDFLPELHVLDLDAGTSRVVVDTWGGVFAAEWCADGGRIAFVGCPGPDRAMRKYDLWTVEVAGGRPQCRTAGLRAGVGSRVMTDVPVCAELEAPHFRVRGEHAYVSGQVDGDVVIYRVALDGPEAVEPVVERAGGAAYLVDVAADGTVLYQAASFTEPPELMLGSRRITALNDELLRAIARPGVRTLEVTASDGLRTQAWALTPPDGTGPWPTVLYIHSGPYGAVGGGYVIDFQLLTGAGLAVVFHNFRGSYGYGDGFSRKITGDWGRAGSLDHHAALDEAIRAGIAAPDRLGVCGLSYGGFATCWLAGTSDRFKAAVAENPVTSWQTAFGAADTVWTVKRELGAMPYEAPDSYRDQSPLTHAACCTTPLLFIVGEDDLRCPPIESEQFYRVLRANGVGTAMLRLPNSSHFGSKNGPVPARIAQKEALVEWFGRHLIGPYREQGEDADGAR